MKILNNDKSAAYEFASTIQTLLKGYTRTTGVSISVSVNSINIATIELYVTGKLGSISKTIIIQEEDMSFIAHCDGVKSELNSLSEIKNLIKNTITRLRQILIKV